MADAKITVRKSSKDLSTEYKILVALVTSKKFLKELQYIYHPNLFKDPVVGLIGQWCLDYHRKYDEAPNKHLKDIFDDEVGVLRDEQSIEFVQKFLIKLSRDYEDGKIEINDAYLLDKAEKYFKKRSLLYTAEQIKKLAEDEEVTKAEALIGDYRKVTRPTSDGVDLFIDDALLDRAYAEDEVALLEFPGALGELLNAQMCRDAFVGFMAPEKRGKTWLLIELMMRTLRARRRVVYFSIGDMTEAQIKRRTDTYLAKRGWKERKFKTLLDKFYPIMDCWLNQMDKCTEPVRKRRGKYILGKGGIKPDPEKVRHQPCTACANIIPTYWFKQYDPQEVFLKEEARMLGRKFAKVIPKNSHKVKAFANRQVSVSDLRTQLDMWEEYDDFIAEVIIIDYADNLAPEKGTSDFRQQQNIIWQNLRALSQLKRCLVITATQSDAQSYSAKIIGLKHFSEDKRKYAHVTAMYGLNQDDEEKLHGILRINPVVVREEEFDRNRSVAVMQNLNIGRPCLGSFWYQSFEEMKGEEE